MNAALVVANYSSRQECNVFVVFLILNNISAHISGHIFCAKTFACTWGLCMCLHRATSPCLCEIKICVILLIF